MQARIMEQVKHLPPLHNARIVLSVEEAVHSNNLLACLTLGDAQFNHVMRSSATSSLMMGTDFEVVSRD